MSLESTNFGFEKVLLTAKAKMVDDVFTNVEPFYDKMNDWMSLGSHHRWKKNAITALCLETHHTVMDLACGSGDLSALIYQKLDNGRLICVDPNQSMLEHCRNRLDGEDIIFKNQSAESLSLPFKLDRAILSFGLRNFTNPELGLSNIHKQLKRGGKLVIMEFNPPTSTICPQAYKSYLNTIIPFLSKSLTNDARSYQYLAESIQLQPTPKRRIEMLSDLQYKCITYSPLQFGIVGLFEAYRL